MPQRASLKKLLISSRLALINHRAVIIVRRLSFLRFQIRRRSPHYVNAIVDYRRSNCNRANEGNEVIFHPRSALSSNYLINNAGKQTARRVHSLVNLTLRLPSTRVYIELSRFNRLQELFIGDGLLIFERASNYDTQLLPFVLATA